MSIFLSFDEFMNAADPPDNFLTPSGNEDFLTISAKIKRAHARTNSDQEYFCEVLSQLCDNPEDANINFDLTETWNTIVQSFDNETTEERNLEQSNMNEANMNEEELERRMKEMEASYFENLQPQHQRKNTNDKGSHKTDPDGKNQDCNVSENKEQEVLLMNVETDEVMDQASKHHDFDLPDDYIDNFTQYLLSDDFDEEYSDVIQEIETAVPKYTQPEQSPSADSLLLLDSQTLIPEMSKSEYDGILRDIEDELPESIHNNVQSHPLPENNLKTSIRSGKTLGIKRDVILSKLPRSESISDNLGYNRPDVDSAQPPHHPRELLYIPSITMPYKFATMPRVNPFKMRQKSAFAKKPIRMHNMEKMIETFRQDRQVFDAAESSTGKSFIHQNKDQGNSRHSNNLNILIQSYSKTGIIQESHRHVPRQPIKFKPEYDHNLMNRSRNVPNSSFNLNIPNYYPQRKITVEQQQHQGNESFAQNKREATHDPLFWLNQPQQKKLKYEERNLFRIKRFSVDISNPSTSGIGSSESLNVPSSYHIQKVPKRTTMSSEEDPLGPNFDPCTFFDDDSGFPF